MEKVSVTLDKINVSYVKLLHLVSHLIYFAADIPREPCVLYNLLSTATK